MAFRPLFFGILRFNPFQKNCPEISGEEGEGVLLGVWWSWLHVPIPSWSDVFETRDSTSLDNGPKARLSVLERLRVWCPSFGLPQPIYPSNTRSNTASDKSSIINKDPVFQRNHIGNCHENSSYKKVSTQQISTLNCCCACSNCFHFAKGDGGIINAIHITFTYDQWWQSFETSSKSNLKWHMAHISIGAVQLCFIWKLDLWPFVRKRKIKHAWQKNTAQPPKPLEFWGRPSSMPEMFLF